MNKIIRRSDLPNKNFSAENVMYSLVKSIKNEKSGTYKDCGFESEDIFEDVLNALERSGLISKISSNNGCKEYNLNNYIYIGNLRIAEQSKRSSCLRWIKENAAVLLTIAASVIELFKALATS